MEPTVAFGGENEKAPDSGLRGRPCHKPSVNDYRYITLWPPSISMVGNAGVEPLLLYFSIATASFEFGSGSGLVRML